MFLKASSFVIIPRRSVQALFVSKRNAKDNVRALWPIFDFENHLKNRTELEENINRRGLEKQINIKSIYDQWEKYKTLESRIKAIEKRRLKLTKLIAEASNVDTSNTEQSIIERYKAEAREHRMELKRVSDDFHDIEDKFCNDFLLLPNKLLSNTPDESQNIFSFDKRSTEQDSAHHLKYYNLIEYMNETCYYLRNEASKFDQIFPNHLLDYFQKYGFSQFSNPDFSKTIIVEGGCVPLDTIYEVEHDYNENCTNLNHLVGNASSLSFLGFVAKTKIDKAILPMQLITTGKIYQLTKKNVFSLFNVVQSTAVQIFLAGTETQMNQKWNQILEMIIGAYKEIGVHFQVLHVPAKQLQSVECFATTFEMYSINLQKYIEVGRLSQYGDFVSKRLRFQCERDETNTQYKPHMLTAIFNVTKILAIILETNKGIIPNHLRNYVK